MTQQTDNVQRNPQETGDMSGDPLAVIKIKYTYLT